MAISVYQAFREANDGKADSQYVLLEAFGEDGHSLFSQHAGLDIWTLLVEMFLPD